MGTGQDIDAETSRRRPSIDDLDPLVILGAGVAALVATLALVFIDPDAGSVQPTATAAGLDTSDSAASTDPDPTATTIRSAPPQLAFAPTTTDSGTGTSPDPDADTNTEAPPPAVPTDLLDDAQRQMLRLYRSAFGRGPDGPGFQFWSEEIRAGTPLSSVAATFAEADEFDRQFSGADPTPIEVVTILHRNGTGATPDAPTLAELLVVLETSGVAEVIVWVSESPATATATGTTTPTPTGTATGTATD